MLDVRCWMFLAKPPAPRVREIPNALPVQGSGFEVQGSKFPLPAAATVV
jgi:hypothetical protein